MATPDEEKTNKMWLIKEKKCENQWIFHRCSVSWPPMEGSDKLHTGPPQSHMGLHLYSKHRFIFKPMCQYLLEFSAFMLMWLMPIKQDLPITKLQVKHHKLKLQQLAMLLNLLRMTSMPPRLIPVSWYRNSIFFFREIKNLWGDFVESNLLSHSVNCEEEEKHKFTSKNFVKTASTVIQNCISWFHETFAMHSTECGKTRNSL